MCIESTLNRAPNVSVADALARNGLTTLALRRRLVNR